MAEITQRAMSVFADGGYQSAFTDGGYQSAFTDGGYQSAFTDDVNKALHARKLGPAATFPFHSRILTSSSMPGNDNDGGLWRRVRVVKFP